jgi:hypothetical protein
LPAKVVTEARSRENSERRFLPIRSSEEWGVGSRGDEEDEEDEEDEKTFRCREQGEIGETPSPLPIPFFQLADKTTI